MFQRLSVLGLFKDEARDLLFIGVERFLAEDTLELDVAVLPEAGDLFG